MPYNIYVYIVYIYVYIYKLFLLKQEYIFDSYQI